jgi:nucleotide-binding universal stress UspA family protein
MLIGSVTEQVVRRAPCAVLSVRPPKAAVGEADK